MRARPGSLFTRSGEQARGASPGLLCCGHEFDGSEERVGDRSSTSSTSRRGIVPLVFEHGRVRLRCPACQAHDAPELSTGARSRFGLGLDVHIAMLAGVLRLSRDQVRQAVVEGLGVLASKGSIDNAIMRMSAILAAPGPSCAKRSNARRSSMPTRLRAQIRELLELCAAGHHTRTANFAAGLLEEYDALWTFCDVPDLGIDPHEQRRRARGASRRADAPNPGRNPVRLRQPLDRTDPIRPRNMLTATPPVLAYLTAAHHQLPSSRSSRHNPTQEPPRSRRHPVNAYVKTVLPSKMTLLASFSPYRPAISQDELIHAAGQPQHLLFSHRSPAARSSRRTGNPPKWYRTGGYSHAAIRLWCKNKRASRWFA